jgi:hypothetical protein
MSNMLDHGGGSLLDLCQQGRVWVREECVWSKLKRAEERPAERRETRASNMNLQK